MDGYFSKFRTKRPKENAAGILFDGEKILLVTRPELKFWQFVHKEVYRENSLEEELKEEVSKEIGIETFEFTRKLKNYHNWNLGYEFRNLRGFGGKKRTLVIMKVNPGTKVALNGGFEEFKWVYPEELKHYTKYYPKIIDEIYLQIKRIMNFPESPNPGELFG